MQAINKRVSTQTQSRGGRHHYRLEASKARVIISEVISCSSHQTRQVVLDYIADEEKRDTRAAGKKRKRSPVSEVSGEEDEIECVAGPSKSSGSSNPMASLAAHAKDDNSQQSMCPDACDVCLLLTAPTQVA